MPSDPLKPSLSLLCKLGSIVVHVDEYLSSNMHPVDGLALQSLMQDPEVKKWVKEMGVFMPVKR